jgi:hypothetical protein
VENSTTGLASTILQEAMMQTLRQVISTMLLIGMSWSAQAQKICVFDPMGASGDIFSMMKDFALMAKGTGVDIKLIPYAEEPTVMKDFKAGQCDGVTITDFSARQFNSYTGSMNAIGGITNNAMAKVVIGLMGNPKLDDEMISAGYEVAGVFPMGPAYILVNNREINSLAKAQGIRFGVLENDPAQYEMIKKVGATPITVTIGNMGTKFNSRQIDAMGAPALAFTAFELHKGMGDKGAFFRFPVTFVSLNLVLKQSVFPATFGAKSRRWFASQTGHLMEHLVRVERTVPDKYWAELSTNDKVGYIRLMREMRIELIEKGVYNKKMTSLLKKVRCQQDPSNTECGMNDE